MADERPTVGDRVRFTVLSEEPWGVLVRVTEWPDWVASVDVFKSFQPEGVRSLLPPKGATGEALIHVLFEAGRGEKPSMVLRLDG